MDATTTTKVRDYTSQGWRPPGCDRIALVLQGGGALGAYQAGVYQALHEADVEPDWVSGVSIGAINSAIIAGNSRRRPVARARSGHTRSAASPAKCNPAQSSSLSRPCPILQSRKPKRGEVTRS